MDFLLPLIVFDRNRGALIAPQPTRIGKNLGRGGAGVTLFSKPDTFRTTTCPEAYLMVPASQPASLISVRYAG